MLAESEDRVLSTQRVSRSLSRATLVAPLKKVPRGHYEIECSKYICGVGLYPPVVVVELCAKVIGIDEVEKACHSAT
jgi:hypothetical protein